MEISQNCKFPQDLIDFVINHADDDVHSLKLKFSRKKATSSFDLEFALVQIEARKKTRKKLSTFISEPRFIFPTLIAAEQASNEAVARFHASLTSPGQSLLDLTAGLGIDAMSFAHRGCRVTACEIETVKCRCLVHNSNVMGLEKNLDIKCGDCIDTLENLNEVFDLIFVDPARRAENGAKVHALADCQPDILSAMGLMRSRASRILVKASPLLDLSLIRNSVDFLSHIYVVCFRGECKEVLMEIAGCQKHQEDTRFSGITVVDLDRDKAISRFDVPANETYDKPNENADAPAYPLFYAKPHAPEYGYLYEPNSGVMKTGAWDTLQRIFPDLTKASPNTHIFVSDTLYPDFPGRVMRIMSLPDKKALKHLRGTKINVVSRNHPLSAPQIESKYGVTSGGTDFLYAIRWQDSPTFLICSPLAKA